MRFSEITKELKGNANERTSGIVRGRVLETKKNADGTWNARLSGCGFCTSVSGRTEKSALRTLAAHVSGIERS